MRRKKETAEQAARIEKQRIEIAVASGLLRYCAWCNQYVPKASDECPNCGAIFAGKAR